MEAAWLPAGSVCKACGKQVKIAKGGVLCRRVRITGTVGGCGVGVCWRCMKRAARDIVGSIRCTQEEFEALGAGAWWMHEKCMHPQDKEDYYGGDGHV
mmetsp:Transcript_3436/g.8963  ORF Transcript_3436/g.8963 Transcript_3436/m.8963 type:complete len:98 (+) Transcript_3436:2-295(+)